MSVQIKDLSKSFSERVLFSGVTFAIQPGERVALVGNNGSGKTTLMKILLGDESPDTGTVIRPRDCRIGYLPQEIFLEDSPEWGGNGKTLSLWEIASQAFSRLEEVKSRLKAVEDDMAMGKTDAGLQERHERLLAEFELAGGYNWQARTTRVLKGLGFPQERFHEPLNQFSGGWQMRAYVARLLLSEPDFLLLDEPTNYLDIASIGFLEEYLSSFNGGILVVSHDRYFLDGLSTSVVALVPEGARVFRGNYTQFLEAYEMWAQEAEAAQERQARERQRIMRFVERFRYKATKAAQVQSRLKMLAKMDSIDQAKEAPKLDFSFPPCPPSGEVVLRANGIRRAYGPHEVLKPLDFTVQRGDRLAVVGENGAGKTTLMRIISGDDAGFEGRIERGYRTFPAYFAQDEEISFEKEESVWERMLREAPFDMVPQLRGLLGAFLFSGDVIERPVRVLSGGEKSRLGLARLMLNPCNLLLLDEPTNHLDISSREALLEALSEFPGTLIFVSHDRFFIDLLATRVLVLSDGTGSLYEGNYSQYLWSAEKRGEVPDETKNHGAVSPESQKETARQSWKEKKVLRNQVQRLQREISEIEGVISGIEDAMRQIEVQLENPNPSMTREGLTELSRRHTDLSRELGVSMEKWESLNQLLESGNQEGASA